MTSVTVKIGGLEYTLKGNDEEQYMLQVSKYVDEKIKELLDKNSKLSVASATVLAAVNIVDELFKGNKDYNNLLADYEQLLSEKKEQIKMIEKVQSELKDALEEIENLKEKVENDGLISENENLRAQLSVMESENKNLLKENRILKVENKEVKFHLQTSKYKVMELQKKFIDSQVNLATEKKNRNPLLNINQ